MFFVKTPFIIQNYYKGLVWKMPAGEKRIYLTFDDGPAEQITPWVLDELKKRNAKATFFCLGINVKRNPDIFASIIEAGHAVGNHGFSHLKGWKTKNNTYFKDVLKGGKLIETKLMRPPYGKIKKSQIKPLLKKYHIIMWDVLSGDYNRSISKERCLKNVIERTESGSIVVFHDSVKARHNMTYVLPKMLDHFISEGFSFHKLPDSFPDI